MDFDKIFSSHSQSCLEKLHTVTEANEKLIAEADKQQQLIAALEQCVNLKDELQRSNALCEEQVGDSQKQHRTKTVLLACGNIETQCRRPFRLQYNRN